MTLELLLHEIRVVDRCRQFLERPCFILNERLVDQHLGPGTLTSVLNLESRDLHVGLNDWPNRICQDSVVQSEKVWLYSRFFFGFTEVAQTDANKAIALLRTQVYTFPQL